MALQVIGAGLGRTGTHSLKIALEHLLDGPCYHMMEVFGRPADIPVWQQAADGSPIDWTAFPEGYVATVDWPAAAFWRELADAHPDALVLLSSRPTDAWFRSASDTIFQVINLPPSDDPAMRENMAMVQSLLAQRFTPAWRDEAGARAAYEAHVAEVRATIPPERLIDWQPGDGWEPIASALGVPVPDAPFPHVNTTSEFRMMTGLDPAPDTGGAPA